VLAVPAGSFGFAVLEVVSGFGFEGAVWRLESVPEEQAAIVNVATTRTADVAAFRLHRRRDPAKAVPALVMVPLPGDLLMAFSLVLRVLRSVVQGVAKLRDGSLRRELGHETR
jgi:hypothetical protein